MKLPFHVIMLYIFLTASGVFAAKSSGTGLEVFDGYNIDIVYKEEDNKIHFTFVIPDQTWLGIVLGGRTMYGTDCI